MSKPPPVLLVTIRFKKRGIMPNEFSVRLASNEFGDHFTIEKLIDEGYKKLQNNSLTARSFILKIPQRIFGYGKYIGYNSSNVLAVYTQHDKGRISLNDVARHVLVNNEVIIVEYYDRYLVTAVGVLAIGSLAYFGYRIRKFFHKSPLALK